jgi:phenylalanyl-tRNA synthetase beta chain
LEELTGCCGIELDYRPDDFYPCLTPGQSAALFVGGRNLGSVGRLHHRVAEGYDFEPEVFLFEIALAPLLLTAVERKPGYQGLARYPAVYRDLAFVVDQGRPAGELLDYLAEQHKLIVGVEIFDVFSGDSLPAGKKSLAFRLTFQDPNKTLTDKKVNAIIAKLIKGIEERFGGVVR